MVFDAFGYTLAYAITGDPRLSIIGAMLGRNPAGVLLLAAASQGGLATRPPGTPTTTPAPPRRVQVPNLPDDQDDALKVLAGHGLVGRVETVASGEEPIDNVIGSEPPEGTVVRVGSGVIVFVSAGTEVPDVRGNDEDEAMKSLISAGFDVETRESKESGKSQTVEKQEPAGGSFANGGSTVVIYVYPPKTAQLKPAEPPE
jgi:hypothetical protein